MHHRAPNPIELARLISQAGAEGGVIGHGYVHCTPWVASISMHLLDAQAYAVVLFWSFWFKR